MKTYFYRRSDGTIIRIEAEQMFFNGACVFVRNGLAAAVICLLPGELVCEQDVIGEVVFQQQATEAGKLKAN